MKYLITIANVDGSVAPPQEFREPGDAYVYLLAHDHEGASVFLDLEFEQTDAYSVLSHLIQGKPVSVWPTGFLI